MILSRLLSSRKRSPLSENLLLTKLLVQRHRVQAVQHHRLSLHLVGLAVGTLVQLDRLHTLIGQIIQPLLTVVSQCTNVVLVCRTELILQEPHWTVLRGLDGSLVERGRHRGLGVHLLVRKSSNAVEGNPIARPSLGETGSLNDTRTREGRNIHKTNSVLRSLDVLVNVVLSDLLVGINVAISVQRERKTVPQHSERLEEELVGGSRKQNIRELDFNWSVRKNQIAYDSQEEHTNTYPNLQSLHCH